MSDESLDDRKAAILTAIVEQYIETDQPVGSNRIAQSLESPVSSATVRNDMAVLEQEGYLHQPHTSAGRVPTDKGYRFFVDHIPPGRLGAQESRTVRSFFEHAHRELEGMLRETSALLADVTHLAAVVVPPRHELARIVSVSLVPLSPTLVLVVTVLSTGVVEKHTLETDAELADDELDRIRDAVAEAAIGHPPGSSDAPGSLGDQRLDDVVTAAMAAVSGQPISERLFVGGTSVVAEQFDAVETVGRVLSILEEQYVLVDLLGELLDRGVSVAIGSETGVEPLADCSVVVAPYDVDGERAGTIGVLGPTRMNYPQALAAVAVVGRRLGRSIEET